MPGVSPQAAGKSSNVTYPVVSAAEGSDGPAEGARGPVGLAANVEGLVERERCALGEEDLFWRLPEGCLVLLAHSRYL